VEKERFMNKVSTKVRFFSKLSQAKPDSQVVNVAFVDEALLKRVPGIRAWLSQFDLQIPLKAGEDLKSASRIESVVETLVSAPVGYARGRTRFFAIGGGSIGDFTGFLASTFLRGVELVQVPTTWVSAMDSAHGGKTALNAAGVKNILGTFHPAAEAWIVEDFFRKQGSERLEEALGEAAKMALLDDRVWKASASGAKKPARWTPSRMWKLLPEIIDAKLRVVAKDPLETKGARRVLNLGHTLGHALEAHHGMPHGKAVGIGLYFSLWVSWCEGVLSTEDFFGLDRALTMNWGLSLANIRKLRMDRDRVARLILRDKKSIASGEIRFIGLKASGKPVQLVVQIDDLLDHLDGFWDET
jgi:3-dehydroquinate synthetase